MNQKHKRAPRSKKTYKDKIANGILKMKFYILKSDGASPKPMQYSKANSLQYNEVKPKATVLINLSNLHLDKIILEPDFKLLSPMISKPP